MWFRSTPRYSSAVRILDVQLQDSPAEWAHEIAAIRAIDFEARLVGSYRLPVDKNVFLSLADHVVIMTWAGAREDAFEESETALKRSGLS
jgi:hypothetical protein